MNLNKRECKYVFRRVKDLIDDEKVVMRDPDVNRVRKIVDNRLTVYASKQSRIEKFQTDLNVKYIDQYKDFQNQLHYRNKPSTLFTLCKALNGINETNKKYRE